MNHIETDIQMAVIALARHLAWIYPELELLYHVPNGGQKNIKQRMRAKHMGELPGVPDLCLPMSDGIYSALYLELKRPGGPLTESQKIVIPILSKHGNKVVICDTVEGAMTELEEYILRRRKNAS